MNEHTQASKLRKEVILNTGLDLLFFLLSLVAVGSSSLDHVIHIVYLMRVADYSSYRPRRRWPIFLTATPRATGDMSDNSELVLFSAFRILMRVWLVFGMTFGLILYAALDSAWRPSHEDLYRLGVLVFSIAILTIHLPKRMLMWSVAVRCPQIIAKGISLT